MRNPFFTADEEENVRQQFLAVPENLRHSFTSRVKELSKKADEYIKDPELKNKTVMKPKLEQYQALSETLTNDFAKAGGTDTQLKAISRALYLEIAGDDGNLKFKPN